MKILVIILTLASTIVMPSAAMSFRFPEIGFCPMGGPLGWFNRMSGQNDQHFYVPTVQRPMYPVAPDPRQSSVRQPNPMYSPYQPQFQSQLKP